MSAIKFTGKLFPDELLKLSGYITRTNRWSLGNLIGYGLLYVVGGFFLVLYFYLRPYSETRGLFLASALSLWALAIARPYLEKLWLRLQIRNQEFQESTAELDEEFVRLISQTSEVKLPWKQIHSILSTPAGLIVMLTPRDSWFFLPERVFTETSKRSQVIDLASRHGVKIREFG